MPWARVGNDDACKAVRYSAQSIPNGANTAVSFTSEDFDTNNMFAPTDSKITIKTAGIYAVSASWYWATNSSGLRIACVEKNAASVGAGTILCRKYGSASQLEVDIATISAIASLAVNDTVHMYVYQNSGGSLNCGSTTGDTLSLSVVRLRGVQ